MYFLLLSLLTISSSWADTWKAGDYEVNLTRDEKGNWSTEECLKECELDLAIHKNLKTNPLKKEELSGGKNPGSVLCRRINGKVFYMKNRDVSQAFCSFGKLVVSLSRVTPQFQER